MQYHNSPCDDEPLFGTSNMLSSCGMENSLTIERPSFESSSFAWSDFPIIQQSLVIDTTNQEEEFSSMSDFVPTLLLSSSGYSTSSTTTDVSPSSSAKPPSKRVSFSNILEIRNYSVVLGDHPCCRTLPVELGWDYADSKFIDIHLQELNRMYCGSVRRRSYLERKNMLQCFFTDEGLSEMNYDI